MGNTGVEMPGAGLGWLAGTVKHVDPQDVVALLAKAIGWEPETRAYGNRWYSESVSIGSDVLVFWAPRSRPDAVETYFEVRQSAFDELGGAGSLKLAADLLGEGARFSRVDGYYDDRFRQAEPGTVAEAFRRGDTVTHIRVIREYSKSTTGRQGDGAALDGATVYLGSEKSEGLVRVYDKAAESGRPDAGIRGELQVRHQHAMAFVTGAVAAGDGLATYLLARIRYLIDFRDLSGQQRGDRAPLLDWWAAIVGDAGRVGLTERARVDSLSKRYVWLERQVAPTLALVHRALGAEWLNDLLRRGEERLTEADWRLLEARPAAINRVHPR